VTDFDITKHEWTDGDLAETFVNAEHIEFVMDDSGVNAMYIRKDDAIALARHFKLKPGDLT